MKVRRLNLASGSSRKADPPFLPSSPPRATPPFPATFAYPLRRAFSPRSESRTQIRGAPAIASLAALGIAAELLALLNNRPSPSFPSSTLSSAPSALLDLLLSRTAYLLTSRPTAVNLREALTRIEAAAREEAARQGATAESLAKKVVDVAVGVWVEDKERCERIGNNGARWILEKLEREGTIEKGEKISVLTVRLSCCTPWPGSAVLLTSSRCAGLQHWLACDFGESAERATPSPRSPADLALWQGYGTAIGVITSLHLQGRLEHAYFAQTGPYQQGARLTAVEMASLGAPNTMICDTAIGALLGEKKVHLFVAGADR